MDKIAPACETLFNETGFKKPDGSGMMTKGAIVAALAKRTRLDCKKHKGPIMALVTHLLNPEADDHDDDDEVVGAKPVPVKQFSMRARHQELKDQLARMQAEEAAEEARLEEAQNAPVAVEDTLAMASESVPFSHQLPEPGVDRPPSALALEMEALEFEKQMLEDELENTAADDQVLQANSALEQEIFRLKRMKEKMASLLALDRADAKTRKANRPDSALQKEIARLQGHRVTMEAQIQDQREAEIARLLDPASAPAAGAGGPSLIQVEIERMKLERKGLLALHEEALKAHAGGRATFMQTEMDHMLDELDALRAKNKKAGGKGQTVVQAEIGRMQTSIEELKEQVDDETPVGAPSLLRQHIEGQQAEADDLRARLGNALVPPRPAFNTKFDQENAEACAVLQVCSHLAVLMPKERQFGGELRHVCQWEDTNVPSIVTSLLSRLSSSINDSSGENFDAAFTTRYADESEVARVKVAANVLSLEREFSLLLPHETVDVQLLATLLRDWFKDLQSAPSAEDPVCATVAEFLTGLCTDEKCSSSALAQAFAHTPVAQMIA